MRLRPLAAVLALLAATPAAAADHVPMAAHRALYQLALESSRGDIAAARGTMNYEVTDACEGWATRQRLAMTVTNRDGQDIEMISDYATWESKDGLSMRFRMRQTTDSAVTEQAEGSATLNAVGGSGVIHYTLPTEKDMNMPAGTVFPMVHTESIINAATAGKKFIALPIFDGTGDKGAQDSSVAITSWGATPNPPYPSLGMPSGRVHIAFFDRGPPQADTSGKVTGSPDYEVGMQYFANGVADDLHMDFSDFVMRGKLAEFTELSPHC